MTEIGKNTRHRPVIPVLVTVNTVPSVYDIHIFSSIFYIHEATYGNLYQESVTDTDTEIAIYRVPNAKKTAT